jgi:hypothetical protein
MLTSINDVDQKEEEKRFCLENENESSAWEENFDMNL